MFVKKVKIIFLKGKIMIDEEKPQVPEEPEDTMPEEPEEEMYEEPQETEPEEFDEKPVEVEENW
jgi:hypothetical protein